MSLVGSVEQSAILGHKDTKAYQLVALVEQFYLVESQLFQEEV
jgi:hypothetical protein